MQTTTLEINLPPEVEKDVEKWAQKKGITPAELVRDAIFEYLKDWARIRAYRDEHKAKTGKTLTWDEVREALLI